MKMIPKLLFGCALCSMIITCSRMPDESLMEKGARLEEEGQFTEAAACYEKLARLYPRSLLRPEALYKAGLVYINNHQDFEKAVSTMQRVIDEHSETKEAAQCQFMIGFVYANSVNDTAKARSAYETFLAKHPEHELVPSVEWELRHLGMDINEIPELKGIEGDSQEQRED